SYFYRIYAVNDSGKSAPSNTAEAVIVKPVPKAPSNLVIESTAKGATSGNYYVNLKWNDNSDDESGFEILQATGSTDNFSVIKTPTANATSYGINIGSDPVETYYFKIRAKNSYGVSDDSNIVESTIAKPVPKAPTGLNIASIAKGSTSGDYYVNLAWTDNATDETGYEILQALNSTDNFTVVKTPGSNSTSYGINVGNNPVGTYYFKVRAVSVNGNSSDSNVVEKQILNPAPVAPSNLTIESVAIGSTSKSYYVNLKWQDNSTDEKNFEILHSVGNTSSFSVIKSPAANTTSYGINIGTNPTKTRHYFKIRAVGTNGTSESNTAYTDIK
ncbi:MAG: hypothetical protein PHV68_02360, partial [Candidatus Gastranaerophilales bacterium]|nr:hypothetical protein [Candidatus Gastranaerophilales bacterium]